MRRYDLGRIKYFESLGVKTMIFWNGEVVKDLERVLMKILKYLSSTPLL